jgi:hypothetical protein
MSGQQDAALHGGPERFRGCFYDAFNSLICPLSVKKS